MDNIQVVCGVKEVDKQPWIPYDELVCEFLECFSQRLRKDKEARRYSDVMTFAFWIRKANIQQKKEQYGRNKNAAKRIGKGVVFHIAPSNVPVNSMFTYVFGLLAGNANVVRIPSGEFSQIACMCRILNELLSETKFWDICKRTSIIKYSINKKITDYYSGQCNVRVIWGGDETIYAIRQSQIPAKTIDVTFADRYSFGIISIHAIQNMNQKELSNLAENFYNDTYLMDQNACSAPHLICWRKDAYDFETVKNTQKRFWKAVAQVASRYELLDIKVSEKYAMLCEKTALLPDITRVETYNGNLLYVCTVDELKDNVVGTLRGKYGLFFQYTYRDINELNVLDSEKIQTCAYAGIEPEILLESVVKNHWKGLDRIVPFGKTLDIDVHWDGYDLVSMLSRQITLV